MIKLIVGVKGTGKTKALIQDVNDATLNSKGSVVCVEYGRKLGFEIKPQARLIDAQLFGIRDEASFYGFICGIFAGNYDVTDLFIDSALKICGDDLYAFEKFILGLDSVMDKTINCVILASTEPEKIPDSIKKFMVSF
ncbi:MAG: hypothetical protein RR246_01560 [Clostridia bacterium]